MSGDKDRNKVGDIDWEPIAEHRVVARLVEIDHSGFKFVDVGKGARSYPDRIEQDSLLWLETHGGFRLLPPSHAVGIDATKHDLALAYIDDHSAMH